MQAAVKSEYEYDLQNQAYDTKLVTGTLLWHETKTVAALILGGDTLSKIRSRVIKENLLHRNTEKTSANIFAYLSQRINAVPLGIVELIASGDMDPSKQATFVSAIAASRVLREFSRDLICDTIENHVYSLPKTAWTDFWNACISKQPKLENTRLKTVSELKNSTFKILSEVSILTGADLLEIRPLKFTPELSSLIKTECSSSIKQSVRCFI